MDLPPLEELTLEKPEEVSPPSPSRAMEDLPPEVLTKILEFATLEGDRTTIFGCRQVNSQWKDIVDSLIEKRIISDEFPVCPKMKLEDNDDQLQVPFSPTRFPDNRNPFPFNSLLFHGTMAESVSNNESERSQLPMLSLPTFTSRFGRNLTSFSLHDQKLSINTLAGMLAAMPSLKRLCFSSVWDWDVFSTQGKPVIIPSPQPLPNLSTLQVKGLSRQLQRGTEYNFISVWLMASYADQLVRLDLLGHFFPPLQPSHEYTYSVADGETRSIVTTSESAFRKLKELKVSCPTPEFLTLSETPALQHFSVVEELFGASYLELEGLITFIERCSSSLETLVLNNDWIAKLWMMDISTEEETIRKLVDGHRPLFVRPSQVVFPSLKTVMLRYPRTHVCELILSELLVKFPSMKRLQLLKFRPHRFHRGIPIEEDVNNEVVEFGNENNINAAEIVTLKEHLSLHFQSMSEIYNNLRLAELTYHTLQFDVDGPAQIRQLEAEIEDLERSLAARITECATIFNGLSALGENPKRVIVEQLLERGGYWNNCPGLRIISVSSAEKPIGDVCVLRRPDDA